jgi:hypothetical protein
VQRFILAELDSRSSGEQLTSNLTSAWHCEASQHVNCGHRPSRAEQESVYRAIRALTRQGLVGVGYIHEESREGLMDIYRNVNLLQIVYRLRK